MTSFAQLMAAWTWRPIRNCPGRYTLVSASPAPDLVELVGIDTPIREYRTPLARNPVSVARIADGGIIAYRRPDGTYLHTLNTEEGLLRKLKQLGIEIAGSLP